MRAFLALWPDPDTALAIERWRSLCWRAQPGAVPVQSLHLTLAFLGDVNAGQLTRLAERLDHVAVGAIDLPLNRVGYQVDQSMLWLEPAPDDVDRLAALHTLVDALRNACGHAGIAVRKGRYRPHVTLARRVDAPASAPLLDPAFTLSADAFALVASERQPTGPRYRTERTWDLCT